MGDEIVQIFDGATTLHLMTVEGKQSLALSAGMITVVPQNTWHQFEAPDGVCVVTATPQPTEHLRIEVEDPRKVESGTIEPARNRAGLIRRGMVSTD